MSLHGGPIPLASNPTRILPALQNLMQKELACSVARCAEAARINVVWRLSITSSLHNTTGVFPIFDLHHGRPSLERGVLCETHDGVLHSALSLLSERADGKI